MSSFSSYRDRLLSKISQSSPIKIEFDSAVHDDLLNQMQLKDLLFAKVFPLEVRIEVGRRLDAITKDGKISGNFSNDVSFVEYIISNGLVDGAGNQMMDESDVKSVNGNYTGFIFDLAWGILQANDFTAKKQETVKNSEGTENSDSSSDLPVN